MHVTFRSCLVARSCLLAGAALIAAAPAIPAAAADVTPAQASMMESQLRDWIGGLVGPGIKIADRPVQMTAAGDHYDVTLPIALRNRTSGSDIQVTGTARPLDGGKWSVQNVRTTTPMSFTIDLPAPPKDDAKAPGGKAPAAKAPPATIPVTYTINLTGQDGTMMLDPSLATPTTFTTSIKSATIKTEGGPLSHVSTIGPSSSVATIRSSGPDRVDLSSEGSAQDYRITAQTADASPIDIGMQVLRANIAMTGISRTRATTITQTLASILGAGMAAPSIVPGATQPKVAPEMVKTLLGALQDFASEMTIDESIDGLAVKYGDYAVGLEKARFGMGAKSDAGILQARLDLGMEGLALPGMPLGGMEALLPKRVAMRPFVSGVGVAELMRIASAGSNKADPAPADIAALFSHGGIVTGLESMAIDVGGASFTGQGKLVFTSPEVFAGTAQVVVENFDELMQKISSMPPLAQAVPVMVFAKGIGRTSGKQLIWDVTYKEGKILVNNIDLSAMAGGSPPAAGTQKAPARPQQQQNRTR